MPKNISTIIKMINLNNEINHFLSDSFDYLNESEIEILNEAISLRKIKQFGRSVLGNKPALKKITDKMREKKSIARKSQNNLLDYSDEISDHIEDLTKQRKRSVKYNRIVNKLNDRIKKQEDILNNKKDLVSKNLLNQDPYYKDFLKEKPILKKKIKRLSNFKTQFKNPYNDVDDLENKISDIRKKQSDARKQQLRANKNIKVLEKRKQQIENNVKKARKQAKIGAIGATGLLTATAINDYHKNK